MNKTNIAQQPKMTSLLPSTLSLLQRKCACGNHTVAGGECAECAKNKKGLQRKLSIGASNDPLELEADRVADQVMAAPPHSVVNGSPLRIQRYAGQMTEGTDIAAASVDRVLASSGRPLESGLRQDMEQRFGHDFSQVRVHSGGTAEQSAKEINANAYTVGHNVVFGAGQFTSRSQEGRRLLAHELTHVVQQSGVDGFRSDQSSGTRSLFPVAQLFTFAHVQRQTKSTKCSDVEVEALNTEMHVYCDKPRSCSMQGDSCATATAKVAAGNGCVDERTKLQQKCYSPGDPGYEAHMLQIAQASAALRNCIAVMTAKCAAEAAAAAALAIALAAVAAAAKKGMKGVAGKALIYAEVAAAIILLASGKAEAKISLEGDSPLEALFKAMEQDGVPVPDDMKKMIESDPELKKMLEESAKKSGNLSDVQKEVAKKYAEYVSQHMDEFSKEELQTLMTTTDQVADKMPATVKVEDIKKALKEKVDKKSGEKQEGDKGTGTKGNDTPKLPADSGSPAAGNKDNATQPTGATPQTSTPPNSTDSQSPKYKDLNDENKKKIKDAPQSVSKLFQEFVSGQKGDVKLDDAIVKKFFEIVPADLTDKQAEALISRLASSQGMTADAVLEALKKGVEEVKKDATAATGGTAANASPNDQPAKSQEQIIDELKEMAKKANFSKIPEGSYSIKNISDKIVDSKISAFVYGKIKGVGVVGSITGSVPAGIDVTKLKVGDSFVITITSQSPFVDKDGKTHKIELSKSITITK